ncbi:MAG: hypothetical protein NVS3B1_17860 [Marmoricola sp.]
MTRRIPRHHLDLLFPSYVLVAAMLLWASGRGWLGEWQWTFDNINGTTVLLGPYAASAAAWRVAHAEANETLYAGTRRGWAVPVRIGLSVFASAGLAWLVVAASGVIGTAVVVHGGPAPVWVLIAGPTVLVTCIAAGLAMAHQWPTRITALVVAPVLFVLGGLGASGHLPDLLHQGPGTASLAGLRWDPAHFWLQMAALLLAAATFSLLSARRRGFRRLRDLALPGVAAVAFVAVVSVTNAEAPQRFVDSNEQATLCASHAPAICVAPSNAHALPSLVAGFAEFLPAARALGFDLPASFREVLTRSHGGDDGGDINLAAAANDPVTPDQVVTALVTPGDCPAYYDLAAPPPDNLHLAQSVLGTMLTQVHAGKRTVLRDAALVAWAQETYRNLRTCRLGSITSPPRAR